MVVLAALAATTLHPGSAAAKRCGRLCAPEISACRSSCAAGTPRARRVCRRSCRPELLAACRATTAPTCTSASPSAPGTPGRAVVVNGSVLDTTGLAVLEQLERLAGARVPDGRYWYDPVSGLVGREGEPMGAQIPPGLPLGGALRADASHGTTDVFVNGRELPDLEVRALERCAVVPPGRYWVDAFGVGGLEGAPPSFDIVALCAAAGVGGGGGGGGGDPWYGSVIGGDGIVGGLFGDTGVTCGPDGGCIYS